MEIEHVRQAVLLLPPRAEQEQTELRGGKIDEIEPTRLYELQGCTIERHQRAPAYRTYARSPEYRFLPLCDTVHARIRAAERVAIRVYCYRKLIRLVGAQDVHFPATRREMPRKQPRPMDVGHHRRRIAAGHYEYPPGPALLPACIQWAVRTHGLSSGLCKSALHACGER